LRWNGPVMVALPVKNCSGPSTAFCSDLRVISMNSSPSCAMPALIGDVAIRDGDSIASTSIAILIMAFSSAAIPFRRDLPKQGRDARMHLPV
jgi:hypothetical protein